MGRDHNPSARVVLLTALSQLIIGCNPTALPSDRETHEEAMVWIPGGSFLAGSTGEKARLDEQPVHEISVDGFWMDTTEVTNREFEHFVRATNYQTTAERAPDLAEIMNQVPEGTPPPRREDLVPGALVFRGPAGFVWAPGANWRHPEGPESSISGRMDHPVVQVSWEDAVAYAVFVKKRLPTEAEWEWAAKRDPSARSDPERLVHDGSRYRANVFQGHFPEDDTGLDGFRGTCPVRSFPRNPDGIFGLAGNVWEWCADWYDANYYSQPLASALNPTGPATSHDPSEPSAPKRVIRGGSFLCHPEVCAGYRPSARMRSSPDTGLNHCGFRCVRSGPGPK